MGHEQGQLEQLMMGNKSGMDTIAIERVGPWSRTTAMEKEVFNQPVHVLNEWSNGKWINEETVVDMVQSSV